MTPILAYTFINLPIFTNWISSILPFKKAEVIPLPTEVVRFVALPLEKVPTI
jgi:hypothetical protein